MSANGQEPPPRATLPVAVRNARIETGGWYLLLVLIGGIAWFIWLLSGVFGPSGFGGDGTPTHADYVKQDVGNAAAIAVAICVFVSPFALAFPARTRNWIMRVLVLSEVVATGVLFATAT